MSEREWPEIPAAILERFNSYLVRVNTGCLLWQGGKVRDGYGWFNVQNWPKSAHRFAFLASRGHINENLQVCHTCDTPACCEPSHLFQGTHQDNSDDMRAKNRSGDKKGAANGNAKLSDEEVMQIRRLHSEGMRYSNIAPKFNITPEMVSLICRRKYRNDI